MTRRVTTDHPIDERQSGPMSSRTRRGGAAVAVGSALALLAGLLVAGGASAAPEEKAFAVSASRSTVTVGDRVQVTVAAGSVEDLYAYSVDLGYDPALLAYVGDSATTAISGATYEKVSPGSVEVTHTKLGSSPATSGQDVSLVTATFTAVGSGSATVTAGDLASVTTAGTSTTTAVVGSTVIGVAAAPVVPAPPAAPKVSTKTSLTAKDRTIRPGRTLRTTVKVTARGTVPTGTLRYTYRGRTVRQRVPLVDGRATVTFRPTAAGRHTLRVTYVPTSGFTASTDTLRIRVKQ
jgi:hypothetical protein